MVQATVIDVVRQNNNIVAYKLKDNHGNIMTVESSKVKGAMQAGSLAVDNLSLINGILVDKPKSLSEQRRIDVQTSKKAEEVHNLVNTLNKAREVYEQGQDEIMSNKEYDALYDQLERLEKETGIVLKNSPTQNVGYDVVSKLEKYTFKTPMLSLAKTKSIQDLKTFLNGKEGVLSVKLDGLTVVLVYNNGELDKAITRGNGEVGEIVTHNAKQFVNIPNKINYNSELIIRGEAIIKYSDFNRINNSGEYKNPRNLSSGTVRNLDSSIAAQRSVNWIAFNVVNSSTFSNNYDEQLNQLKQLGFTAVPSLVVNSSNIEEAVAKLSEWTKKSDLPADGLVLTYRDTNYGKSLGRTAKTPKHSIAFKWEDEEHITYLRDIEWSVGRTGVITPVAIFDPIEIEGSVVSRASLHNISMMYDILGQPYVGQRVSVYKANLIIPQIAWGEKIETN